MEDYSDFGIEVGNKLRGQIATTCPQCSHNRKKKTDKCLSINLDERVWHCHHCDWKGGLNGNQPLAKWENSTTLSDATVEWFLKRNIPQAVLVQMKIGDGTEWMPQAGNKIPVIMFPYFRDGHLINTKFRGMSEKCFKLTKGAELIPYNLDGIKNQDTIYITEGEIDALTLITLGHTNVVSVPNGASPKNNNLQYINLSDFAEATTILIATDADAPGNKLALALADKLGRERCKRVLYGGHKDVNELYCKEGDIKKMEVVDFIEQASEETKGELAHWRDFIIDSEPPEETPLIKIGDAPIATTGNHSLVIGKKKSRKSLFLVLLLSLYQKQNPLADLTTDVLIADTEQGKRHVWKAMDRIYRMTGQRVTILHLRGKSHTERKQIIEAAIREMKPKIVIIDGIRDLISNINDADQSTELIIWIERITLEFGVHIVNVLHQNKTDNNARGHIGSELLNKAEVTIDLERNEQADCTIVKCESSRDIPFETFAFTHNEQGLPEMVSTPTKGKVMTDSDRKARLKSCFDGELLKYAEIVEAIKANFAVGENKAGQQLAECIRLGWVAKNGKPKSPDTTYKLMV